MPRRRRQLIEIQDVLRNSRSIILQPRAQQDTLGDIQTLEIPQLQIVTQLSPQQPMVQVRLIALVG